MLIQCTKAFRDLKSGGWREIGDRWEADEARFDEINRAGYGQLVKAVEVAAEAEAPATEAPVDEAPATEAPKPKRRAPRKKAVEE